MERGEKGRREGLRFVLVVFVASRLFYLVSGGLLYRWLPPGEYQSVTSDTPYGTLNLWAHWDGEFYARLALDGYLEPPSNVSPAFFPMYSFLIGSLARLFGGPLSLGAASAWGVLVSLMALPFALYFVYRIAEDGWGARVAQGTVLTLALFPTSFYLNAAYTESLFLALSAGSVWAARVRRDLLLACLLAALAAATRNVGIFLLVPLAFEWWRGREEYGWRVGYLSVAPSGLLLYACYQWWRMGEPLLFYTDQKDWGREAGGPFGALAASWQRSREGSEIALNWVFDPDHPPMTIGSLADHASAASNAYDLIFLSFAAALLIAGIGVLPLGLGLYASLLVLVPVLFGTESNPLMGMPRYVLVAFPLFIVLGEMLQDRRALAGWLLASTTASLLLCALFVSWRFVA